MSFRKDQDGRLQRRVPFGQALEWAHGCAGSLATAGAALTANLDPKNGFPGHEQRVAVELLGLPFEAICLEVLRALACCRVEILVAFFRRGGA